MQNLVQLVTLGCFIIYTGRFTSNFCLLLEQLVNEIHLCWKHG